MKTIGSNSPGITQGTIRHEPDTSNVLRCTFAITRPGVPRVAHTGIVRSASSSYND